MAELADDRVACRTPAVGRSGATRIPRWKYDAVRKAILDELATGDVPFRELSGRVRGRMQNDHLERLGSVNWHVTTVKLEMEVRGEIARKQVNGYQYLHLLAETS